jgi:protein-disulfide isomerase
MEEQKSVLNANKNHKKEIVKKVEKKKPVGLIVAVICLSAALIAAVVVLIVVLLNNQGNSQDSSSDNEKTGVIENEPKKNSKKSTSDDNKGIAAATKDNGYIGDHVRGKRDSKVLVVEYADLQCPGCATMMPEMDTIYKKYKNKVAFVYRHYPIASHQNARSAAIAVEAAGAQGYYWEMLSAMFENRYSWISITSESKLKDAYVSVFKKATNSKGDVAQFKKDLAKDSFTKKVDSDKSLGQKDKVSATPTIIVNGEQINAAGGIDDWVESIEDAIEDALDK